VRICIRVCAYMYTRMCVYVYTYVRICIRVCAYMYTRMCVYVYTYVRICIRVCAYMYTCMCVYTYAYMRIGLMRITHIFWFGYIWAALYNTNQSKQRPRLLFLRCFKFFLEFFLQGVPLLHPCCLPSYLRGFWIHRRLVVYAARLLWPKQDYFKGHLAMPHVVWMPRVYREAPLN